MKKILAVLLAMAMVFGLVACGEATDVVTEAPSVATEETEATEAPAAEGKTVYVMGPTPDHGWTAQAGAYASAKCEELTAAGTNATYIAASSGEEQVDQCNTIIANGDAAVVVMMALDDGAQAGQEALIAAGIPLIQFDRIIEATEGSSALNFSGDNWAVGAGIAYWLQTKGMKAGSTVVVLYGDNGTVCSRREEGFRNFLLGAEATGVSSTTGVYHDKNNGDFTTAEVWDQAAVDAVFTKYVNVCDWSADGAYTYFEQKLADIVADAKANDGNLYIYSMDDEMTFGLLNYLEAAPADLQADFEALNVYTSAIGGMQELYDVMNGKSEQAATSDKYFDDIISMDFNPSMMNTAIEYGVQLISGEWSFATGDGSYQETFIVDKTLAATVEGFTGH